MGRNKGTNDYSNNFEPQVTGLLDARTRVDTKADLLLASTWASTDGNVYLPKGIRVSVTDDTTAANNGVYMLMADDYTVASNWMKIGQNGGGGSKPIYLTTDGLLDATTDTNLRTTDIEQLSRLFTISDEVPNIKYVGLDMGGSTFYHVEMNVSFTTIDEPIIAMFIHPTSGDGMAMQLFVNTGTASAPMAMGYMNSVSGGSSNIKMLTTPDLMNINRTTSLKLNPADTLAITTFTKNDILISNSVPSGSASGLIVNIPISIQKAGTTTVGVVLLGWVSASKNYNMILNISNGTVTAQPPVESSNSSGGSGEAAYVTTLALENIRKGNAISSDHINEIYNIFNKWQAGIPVIFIGDRYRGVLNINPNQTTWDSYTVIALSIRQDNMITSWTFQNNINLKWDRNLYIPPLSVSLYDLYLSNEESIVWEGELAYEAIDSIDSMKSQGMPIVTDAFDGTIGLYNIHANENDLTFFVDSGERKYRVDYRTPGDGSIIYTAHDVTPYDLGLEVRIRGNQVEFKVNEIVPNGYICLYRKKRCTCSKLQKPNRTKQNKYTIPYFYFPKRPGRLQVEGLRRTVIPTDAFQPNVWNVLPIPSDMLASQDSTSIRFKGNVHAKPCELTSTTGTALNKKTAVLNLGLAYNVINPNYINGYKENNAIPNDIVRAGNMVKFKARLNCLDITNINSGYQMIYTMD